MDVDQELSEESTQDMQQQEDSNNSTENAEADKGESPKTNLVPEENRSRWEEFKCVFCKKDLKDTPEPKLLHCLHTACKKCIDAQAINGPSPTNVLSKQVSCPECDHQINMNDVVDHLFVVEYLNGLQTNTAEEKSYPCTCDENADGTAFCKDCQEWLCDACVTAHQRVRLTKDHHVRPKAEMEEDEEFENSKKYMFCPIHSNEKLTLYCESCDKLTCRDCQLSVHKDHKYQFLEKACDEQKESIRNLIRRLKEKQMQIENVCNLLNARHEEISEREAALTKDIRKFAVVFISEINKRAKMLLSELNRVCTEKKNQLMVKHQELKNLGEKIKHGQKFAEASITHGSETALVYSKKPINTHLLYILKNRCEGPTAQDNVDINFTYESSFLMNYISQMGSLIVDKQAITGLKDMLPMPNTIAQNPAIHTPTSAPQVRQLPTIQQQVNRTRVIQTNHHPQQQLPQQQQQQHQRQQPVPNHYGQPQVTTMARNQNNPAQMANLMVNKVGYVRSPQRTTAQNAAPLNPPPYNMQTNAQFQQRQVNQQQVQIRTVQQNGQQHQPQVQQQHQQQQQQQQQPQQQQYNPSQLPMPLRQNKNISVTAIPSSPSGPTPPKQRALAPRPNSNVANLLNQQSPAAVQRMNSTPGQPQVIVLDDQPAKTPTMSNTSRLSHFPNVMSTIAANPNLQIQPANYRSSGSKF